MTSSVDPAVGLCVLCAHGHVVLSDRGGRYWRCRRSEADGRYVKYPLLPVVDCDGYVALPSRTEDPS